MFSALSRSHKRRHQQVESPLGLVTAQYAENEGQEQSELNLVLRVTAPPENLGAKSEHGDEHRCCQTDHIAHLLGFDVSRRIEVGA